MSTNQFAFHGIVTGSDETHTSVRLFPGLILDIRKEDIEEIQEATDEITQRSYVYVRLKEDADIRANFRPRLARLAMAAERGVPFEFGGTVPESDHALPSGGAQAIPPSIDPQALAALASRIPPETLKALVAAFPQAMLLFSHNTTTTTYSGTFHSTFLGSTDYKSFKDENDHSQGTKDDHETDTINDPDTKKDTTSDPGIW